MTLSEVISKRYMLQQTWNYGKNSINSCIDKPIILPNIKAPTNDIWFKNLICHLSLNLEFKL